MNLITSALEYILQGLLEHLKKGNVTVPLIIVIVFLATPSLWAIYTRYWMLNKIESLYKEIIKGKNAEISRLTKHLQSYIKTPTKKKMGEDEIA